MTPIIFLGVVMLIPLVLGLVLRVNAAVMIMSLCLGEVLVQYVSGDAVSIVRTLIRLNGNDIRLLLLIVPLALTALFMIRSVSGIKAIFNLIPALGAGLLLALFSEPLLSAGVRFNVENSSLWHSFSRAKVSAVIVAAGCSLLFLWVQKRGGSREHGKRR